jgi:hypothetical protein
MAQLNLYAGNLLGGRGLADADSPVAGSYILTAWRSRGMLVCNTSSSFWQPTHAMEGNHAKQKTVHRHYSAMLGH